MMQPISGLVSGAAQSPASISGVKGPLKAQRPEEQTPERSSKPVFDEYVPEKKQGPDTKGPDKKAPDDRAESTTCNTDAVDREIEKLRKKQEELKQQLNSETDSRKIRELEKKLAQVEGELSQKDNDTYRRRYAAFS